MADNSNGAEPHDSFALEDSPVGDKAIFGTADNNAEGAFDISSTFDPGFDLGHVQGAGEGQPVAHGVDAPGSRRLPTGKPLANAPFVMPVGNDPANDGR